MCSFVSLAQRLRRWTIFIGRTGCRSMTSLIRAGQRRRQVLASRGAAGPTQDQQLDLFFYHYMGMRKLDEIKVAHVFQEFKDWWESSEPRDISLELERISALAQRFSMMLAPDQKLRFGLFCRRLRFLDTATPIPLVLYLLEHHKPDAPDLIHAIGDIESYLVRRFVCGLTSKSYNRTFIQRLLAEMAKEGKPMLRRCGRSFWLSKGRARSGRATRSSKQHGSTGGSTKAPTHAGSAPCWKGLKSDCATRSRNSCQSWSPFPSSMCFLKVEARRLSAASRNHRSTRSPHRSVAQHREPDAGDARVQRRAQQRSF